MPITLEDIARKAGVSRSTVSRALSDQGRMSAETRDSIKGLAQEMGYVPNFLAQSLHETKTRMIGVVITMVSDPFIWELIEGIEQVADDSGYTLFLGASKFDPDKEIEMIVRFYQRRVDGIIVQTSHLASLYSPKLEQIDIPIVLINDEEEVRVFSNVTINEQAEAQKAVEYLISIGHRKIGYVGSSYRPFSSKRRMMGYRDAHIAQNLTFVDTYVFASGQASDVDVGRKVLDRIMDAGVTAVFCYNDVIAISLIHACRERGIGVPNDLSIMGFDNIEQAGQFYPSLTTIHQPKFELGNRAMQMIQANSPTVMNEVLPCKLIVRESTRSL